jgi:glycerol uptake facilitator-like aquaporin
MSDLPRRLAAEGIGAMLLLAAVVGSGIMAERLTQDVALALLCNTLATGAILFVLIVVFAPISGAHFNPAVTLVMLLERRIRPVHAGAYVIVQIGGAILGVLLAHAMFGATIFAWGVKSRAGLGQWISEAVAVFGLVLTSFGLQERKSVVTVAASVALWIVAAYWFAASTSFANPAVTLARSLTPSFAGILPHDVPAFIAAQISGALAGWSGCRFLFPRSAPARDTGQIGNVSAGTV